MMRVIKRLRLIILILGMVLVNLRCNEAPIGFSAPSGSTIIAPADIAVETVAGSGVYILMTIEIKVPGAGGELTVGNDIFMTVTCSLCTIFDRADGANVTVPDPSLLQSVSNIYSTKTTSRGVKQIVIFVNSPATLGQPSYSAILSVDIGVASAQTTISVSELGAS